MARVDLYCGGAASARAEAVDRVVLEHWGHALLLVPTRACAASRAEELILGRRLAGAWGPCVLELNDFARAIIEKGSETDADGHGRPRTRAPEASTGTGAHGPVLLRSEISNLKFQISKAARLLDDFERRLLVERCIEGLAADETPGFIERRGGGFAAHVLRVITQLKQSAVEPDAFTQRLAAAGRTGGMDAVVAAVYGAYQEALKSGGLYDVPGVFWEAELVCRARRPHILQDIGVLVLDGFDDFTPSQLRLIETAARHVDRLVIGVNLDPNPDRQDLYALSATTVHDLAHRFGATPVYFETPPPCGQRAYAAHKVFWRDPPRADATRGLARDLAVVPCADPTQEVEMIARRVKRLLAIEGIPPEEVAVVYRRLGDMAATVRAVFAECGVPVRVMERPRLAESAVGVFVRQLFEAWEDWAREAVLEVVMSPLFHDTWSQTGVFPKLARDAGIIGGREAWERAGGALADCVRRLDQLDGVLPERTTREAFAEAFEGILDALHLEGALARLPDAETADREARALEALRRLLARLAEAYPGAVIERAVFVDELRAGLQETEYTPPAPQAAVTVYGAQSVRNLRFDYVFFGGLNEGLIPQPAPVNAVYSDADVQALRKAGIPLEDRAVHIRRERLLFHHVLETARKRLTLSWHVQERGGREAGESPFLVELLELFPDRTALVEPAPRSDTFVPPPEFAASRRDLGNCAFFRAPEWQAAFSELFEAVERGAAIEKRRQSEAEFDAYDGVLLDPALIASIARAYGPDHRFSVSRLETYLDCPFRFFMEVILKIDPAEEPSAEFDPLLRGGLLHEALRRFHAHFRGRAIPAIPEKEARKVLRRVVAEVFASLTPGETAAPAGVVAMEQRRMETVLDRYLTIERDRDESDWTPAHFEVAFGGAPRAGSEEIGTETAFPLETDAGPVLFAGRIDRIDTGADSFRIIDYKTGAPPEPKEIKAGRSIQMGVYALAAERLLIEGHCCAAAWFIQPGKGKRVEALGTGKKGDEAESRRGVLIEAVAAAVRGMRAGRFPPTASGGCAYCDARRACRFERARIERKTSAPAGADEEAAGL